METPGVFATSEDNKHSLPCRHEPYDWFTPLGKRRIPGEDLVLDPFDFRHWLMENEKLVPRNNETNLTNVQNLY
jgi:hypothetical protein